MTEHVGALLDEYPGPAAHDATGGGNAMGEFPALAPHDQLQGVTLVGRVRTDLFRNYIGMHARPDARPDACTFRPDVRPDGQNPHVRCFTRAYPPSDFERARFAHPALECQF